MIFNLFLKCLKKYHIYVANDLDNKTLSGNNQLGEKNKGPQMVIFSIIDVYKILFEIIFKC